MDALTPSPKASIEEVAWIQGHWIGKAFGGTVEELWSPPMGSSMMGSFKLILNGEIEFYELITLSEEENSLVLRLRHFDSDLTAWEDMNEPMEFPLAKIEKDRVLFSGFTFERKGPDKMNVYVLMESETGSKEMKITYTRHR